MDTHPPCRPGSQEGGAQSGEFSESLPLELHPPGASCHRPLLTARHLECVSGRPGLTFAGFVPRDRLLSADTDNLITSIFSPFYFYFDLSFDYFLSSSLV